MKPTTFQFDALTPELELRVDTGAVSDDVLLRSAAETRVREAEWQRVIDDQLIEWGLHPEALEEDDLIPPTRRALQVAGEVAIEMRKAGEPAPKRVVPDRDGGIAFERWEGDRTVTIMVSEDGAIEVLQWIGSKIVAP
jgi:hypothetical protein